MENIKVSYVVVTHNRKEKLKKAIDSIQKQEYKPKEIVIADNASTDDSVAMVNHLFPNVKVISLTNNTGRPGGNNVGIQNSNGEIIIFIEDDSFIVDESLTTKVVNYFIEKPNLGIIAFKIVDLDEDGQIKMSFVKLPSKIKNKNLFDREFETTYFLGSGFAVRRKVFEKAGFFSSDIFFMKEELDLSYRVLQAGFSIVYSPNIAVFHHRHSHKSYDTIVPLGKAIYFSIRNQYWIAYRYLPFYYFLSQIIFWSLFLGFRSIRVRAFSYFLKGAIDGLRGIPKILLNNQRKILNRQTVNRIKELNGRLWY